jgi:hypothetical protein
MALSHSALLLSLANFSRSGGLGRKGQHASSSFLHTLVFVRRAHHHRNNLLCQRRFADDLPDLVDRIRASSSSASISSSLNMTALPAFRCRAAFSGAAILRESASNGRLRPFRLRSRRLPFRIRSMTPSKRRFSPIGICNGTALTPQLVLHLGASRFCGLAPVRSILLMNAMRGTP